jgi:hypothetical protein
VAIAAQFFVVHDIAVTAHPSEVCRSLASVSQASLAGGTSADARARSSYIAKSVSRFAFGRCRAKNGPCPLNVR